MDKTDNLTSRVQHEFPEARNVHRLDMSTSGLLLFARNADMHRRLSRLFRERGVTKNYVAIIAGKIGNVAGEVELPISPDWPNRPRQKIDFEYGKNSLTRYRLLAYDAVKDTSRIELAPITGRTHQLRIHMAAIGHSIIGDTLYGGEAGSKASRLLLHASMLGFIHPLNSERLILLSEAPF